MATLQLQDLRQYNGDLTENDLMLFKIKRRVDMPADEDMGVRYSQFLQQINLDRFVKKAGDTMFGDLIFQNNRGIFGTATGGALRALFKLNNSDTVVAGNLNHQLLLQAQIDPKVTTQSGTYTLYHAGNSNLSTIDWSARNITAHQTLSVLGESTMANLTIKKLSAIYGYDAGNLKVRMIGIDADDDVAVGVVTKRFGILVKDPNEIWAVQEEGNPAKQWRVLTTGNFTTHLNNTYVLKTQTVNGKALAGNITLNAADVGALALTGGTLTGDIQLMPDSDTANPRFLIRSKMNRNSWIELGETDNNTYHGMYMQYSGATDNIGRIGMISSGVWNDALRIQRDTPHVEVAFDANVLGILREKGQRVYSPNNKPSADEVGAVSSLVGGQSDINNFGKKNLIASVNGGTPDWVFEGSGGALLQTSHGGYLSQLAFKSESAGLRLRVSDRESSVWSDWIKVYTSVEKPTASELGVYTQQEVNQKVTKTVTLNAPDGVVAGKYYPILINGGLSGQVKINTRSTGGTDPMNNCSFDGMVRSGGWTDQVSFVDGVFTIFQQNERAIAGIAVPTESAYAYAIYVEARAFPVQVTVDGTVSVTTSATDRIFGSSVFKAGITMSDEVGTNVKWQASFTSGSGRYYNSYLIASATGGAGGSGGVFGQVSTFAFPPDEPWIILDGRAFDTAKYPRLAQKFPSGHVPNYLNRYPKYYNGTEGAGTTYSWSLAAHSHTFSGTGTAATAGNHGHGSSSGDAGDHTHSAWTDGQGAHHHDILWRTGGGGSTSFTNQAGSGEGWSSSWGNKMSDAGHHAHNVGIGSAGVHQHPIYIAAGGDHTHSVSISGNTGTSGASSSNEVDRVVLIPAIYAA